MTLLLIITTWLLLFWLITGLCAAARLGDRGQPGRASAPARRGELPAWEAAEHAGISAHTDAQAVRSAESREGLAQTCSMAA